MHVTDGPASVSHFNIDHRRCNSQQAWRQRRTGTGRRIIDARFDANHVLFNASRRLVNGVREGPYEGAQVGAGTSGEASG